MQIDQKFHWNMIIKAIQLYRDFFLFITFTRLGNDMKRFTPFFSALLLLAMMAGTVAASPSSLSSAPYFVVNRVETNGYVFISLYNFPSDSEVKVYMGSYGTLGIGGAMVGSFNSSSASEFRVEMATLVFNQYRVAIRVEAPAEGIYLSGSFINSPYGTTSTTTTTTTTTTTYGTGGPITVPTLEIVTVDPDVAVTVRTHNFPVGDTFDALMDEYGTLAVNGYVMKTVKTTAASELFTVDIPTELKGQDRLAIRFTSDASGYYSYDWFTNKSGSKYGTGGPYTTPTTTPVSSLPSGVVPTFTITSVAQDGTVTVQTRNLPASDTFDVYMNTFGTAGVGGTKVDSVSTGSGGTQNFTFNIPSGLKGLNRIAIRMQSTTNRYYAYNWFWNSTYP